MINTFLFDMDGVICHTNPHHSKAFHIFFEKRGMVVNDNEFSEHMYGKNNRYIFNYFLKKEVSEKELTDFENEKESLFREIYKSQVEAIEGFPFFLNRLAQSKYKLGVATSAPTANMDLILDTLGVRSHFKSTLASEDVQKHKPFPEVYLKSADNLNSLPEECLVFEDSFSGIMAAKNAGMKVVGVLSSHTKEELPACEYYIEKYDANLWNFVDNLLSGE